MRSCTQRLPSNPFVLNPAHEQRAIELDRTRREDAPVVEKAGFDLLDGERLNLPCEGMQLQAVEHTGFRVTE
jgi:hypothetical protein